jgi:hypothetical protein
LKSHTVGEELLKELSLPKLIEKIEEEYRPNFESSDVKGNLLKLKRKLDRAESLFKFTKTQKLFEKNFLKLQNFSKKDNIHFENSSKKSNPSQPQKSSNFPYKFS